MTQTVKGQKGAPQPQKPYRPGQRQQERLERQARRRRQRMIILGSLLGVVLIALAGVGIWQYPRIAASFQRPVPVAKTCSVATSSTNAYASTPAAGPTAPPAVRTTPAKFADGLQCIDLKIGNGPAAQIGSVVTIEYTGWLAIGGRKFDSSYDHHGKPFPILLGGKSVMQGMEEGLMGLKAGGIRRLIIPPGLGYGDQGQSPTIPGGATLIFDLVVQSVSNCPLDTSSNIYNSTPPSAANSTPVVGPTLPSGPTSPPPLATTPSTMLDGLQCIDIKLGSGIPAETGRNVSVEYTGWFAANGKKFDSSYDHGGTPFSVPVGQGKVIKGFDQGLIGMKVGGTRRLIIPPALGYGVKGQLPQIPPNATLIFDVTVVSISN